ncbi:MAG TPA: PHB depolymerase family esterase [Hymenobacter sp.]|jgi:polyhydroxybutyrate depolymerase|uniref:extracellular catalytic domain type 1 short-chain-length polyhydroxyalkanoate depolymerase n=1 Tax=Hymenobacter sp. TaxID=1898978 RepID=UPI002ED9E2A1
MRQYLPALLAAAVVAFMLLLPAKLRAQTTIVGTIRHGGLVREYRLYVPAIYNTTTRTVPLLFNLHGYGSNNIEQEMYGDFRPIADTANFLIVHPNGIFDAANNRNWNTFGPRGTGVDDVAFLSALLDTMATRYRLDPDRIFSTGMSNGGFMSYELACQLSNRIAAVASVTGTMTTGRLSTWPPGRPVPVLEIHGTDDIYVPYTGSASSQFAAIPTLLAAWVQRNGCNPVPTIAPVPDTNTADGSTAERSVWTGGPNGGVVEHYRIIGGGHTWPGAAITLAIAAGTTNRDINASNEVWRFLRPYRLSRVALATAAAKTSIRRLEVFPNPTATVVTIHAGTSLSASALTLHDALGRALPHQAQVAADGNLRLTTETWPRGMYLVRVQLPTGEILQQKLVKE